MAARNTRVKAFVLTKNEYDLIDDFIVYYSQLLGAKNVVIIDNGSTDTRVLASYSRHPDVHVIKDHRPMTEQRHMMTDAMRKHASTCDFMMPLDTDEFALWNGEAMQHGELHEYLATLPDHVDVVRYDSVWFSVPNPNDDLTYVDYSHERPVVDIVDFERKPFDKIIVRSCAFVAMNPGNHSAVLRTRCDDVTASTTAASLSLLHYHDVGVRRTYERTVAAVRSYGFVQVRGDQNSQQRNTDLHSEMITCGHYVRSVGGHHAVHYLRFLARRIFIDLIRDATGCLPSLHEMWSFCCHADEWMQRKDDTPDFGTFLLTHVLEFGVTVLQNKDEADTDDNTSTQSIDDVRVHASQTDVERFFMYGVGWDHGMRTECVRQTKAVMKKVFSATSIDIKQRTL